MRYHGRLGLMIVLATAFAAAIWTPSTVHAQEHAVTVFAHGGGFNGLSNLNDAGTVDFSKIGYNVGGGLAVQLQRYVALRGDLTYARNQMQINGADAGTKLNRFFYTGAVQLQVPTSSGFMPYVYAGGGAVTLHEVGTSGQNKTKGAGVFGLGLDYQVPGSQFGVFAEGTGWLWKASNLNGSLSQYDKTQFDLGWSGGVSYRFPF